MKHLQRAEREFLKQADRVAILSECFTWMQRCNKCVEQLEERNRVKRPWLTVRQSLVARIAQLAGAKMFHARRW